LRQIFALAAASVFLLRLSGPWMAGFPPWSCYFYTCSPRTRSLLLFAAAPLLFVRVSFYLLAQNWVLVDFVANDFCWLPLRLHKL